MLILLEIEILHVSILCDRVRRAWQIIRACSVQVRNAIHFRK